MGKNQHVVKKTEGWAVRGEKNEEITSMHKTQKEAITAAMKIAKIEKSEVVIHDRDNKIRDKDSYGNDPIRSKDTKF